MASRVPYAAAIAALIAVSGPAASEDESPAPNAAQTQNPTPVLKAGANSFAESQARALLQSKGYRNISQLVNDREGIWHGTATKDEQPVSVSVDFQGHVAER